MDDTAYCQHRACHSRPGVRTQGNDLDLDYHLSQQDGERVGFTTGILALPAKMGVFEAFHEEGSIMNDQFLCTDICRL
jgi:hypothetical protein